MASAGDLFGGDLKAGDNLRFVTNNSDGVLLNLTGTKGILQVLGIESDTDVGLTTNVSKVTFNAEVDGSAPRIIGSLYDTYGANTQNALSRPIELTAGIKFNSSLRITGGSTGGAYTNPNSWSLANLPIADLRDVAFGNGVYVAVGLGSFATSTDGITWTTRTNPGGILSFRRITFGNGIFVTTAPGGSTSTSIYTSTDGITWTARTSPSAGYEGVFFGNSLFVAFGISIVSTSTDGITWTSRTATGNWRGCSFGAGRFVLVSATSTAAAHSTDGATWTVTTNGINGASAAVTFANNIFVAVGGGPSNYASSSTDGITWTARTAANALGWQDVEFGNGQFIAVASSGGTGNRIMSSTDGITWTARTSPANNQWSGLVYGNNQFVAVSSSTTNGTMRHDPTYGPQSGVRLFGRYSLL
jgi:hypothetical protein